MPVIPSTPVSGKLYHGPRQFPVGRRTLSRWPWQETWRKAMAADRRTVLIAGLAAPAIAAGERACATQASHIAPPRWMARSASTTGRAPPPRMISATSSTSRPSGVLLPASAEDVAATIRWAGGRGRKFAARGRGHSVFGRSMARAGIVGDMSRLRAIRVENDRVVVEAGATWREVLGATLPRGLTPPVLTDYLDLSVGGTLAVGGVGGTTSHFGVQCDNVLALEVVTGQGQKVTCSASRHDELFDAIRAGLGQVGVVTRATLRLVPAPSHARQFQMVYSGLPAMLADARLLARDGRFDVVRGAILATPPGGWSYRLDAAKYFSGQTPDDGALLAGLSDDTCAAAAEHTCLSRLPRPVRRPGGCPAGEWAVVLPASVAHDVRRRRRGRGRGWIRAGKVDTSGSGHLRPDHTHRLSAAGSDHVAAASAHRRSVLRLQPCAHPDHRQHHRGKAADERPTVPLMREFEAPAERFTQSARYRCLAPTGAGISDLPSIVCARPSVISTPTAFSRRAILCSRASRAGRRRGMA